MTVAKSSFFYEPRGFAFFTGTTMRPALRCSFVYENQLFLGGGNIDDTLHSHS